MPTGGTIAAIGTPQGHSARAIIRISGPDARECIESITTLTDLTRGIHHARIRIDDRHALPCQVIWFDGPRSYTGEDVAELVLVGNPVILQRTLDRIYAIPGLHRAQPGEFSARAYLNDRLTLAQAEGVALRIAAVGDEALDAAAKLLDGTQGDRCNQWTQELALLLALVESGVDFTDQDDVVPIAPDDLADRLSQLNNQLIAEIGSAAGSIIHATQPNAVICGVPNAGKSALFNALIGRQRAVVSDRAGTTRDAISEPLSLEADIPGAGSIELIDLAGLADHAIDAIDAQAQEIARQRVEDADVLLWCDPTGRFSDRDGFETMGKPIIRVRTKSDLILDSDEQSSSISVCALDGHHLGVLKRAIADAVSDRTQMGVGAFVPRHRRAITQAITGIHAALQWIPQGAPSLDAPELVASGLRDALDSLGELTGQVTPDDVIGRVFATFCVGK
tara:strand:+ start:236577 stop:237926 length:1350 start_codon:yes stop_codon:yes gene_type:complete